MRQLFERLLAEHLPAGRVADVRIGLNWTAVVLESEHGLRAGLAATLTPDGWAHGRPFVRVAGTLVGLPTASVTGLLWSDSPTERSLGLAALNALIDVTKSPTEEGNAEALLLGRAPGRRVAVIGHFPFVDRLRTAAETCWVLELRPGPSDLPADLAPEIVPQADIVVITAMSLLNDTFESLVRLPRADAFVLLLGPTTPLSPVLFDYGVDAISGTVVLDIPTVLAGVSEGANFHQIKGKQLVTLLRPRAELA